MDFVSYCTNFIRRSIPIEVLDIALTNRYIVDRNYSLDKKIEDRILRNSFYLDLNLMGGVEITVPIETIPYMAYGDDVVLFKIPNEVLQGRRIINVLSISTQSLPNMTSNDFNSRLYQIENDHTNIMYASSTTKLEKVSDSEILVYENIANINNSYLRLVIEYSDRFNEINPRSYLSIAKTAVLATKAFIHNEMVVKMNQSQLYSGHEIGVMSSIVDDYADSMNDYLEVISTTTKKILFMNDRVSMHRFIKNMMPSSY